MSNRLAQSQSLYLRKHADNPIAWWPWCDAALETAKREDKPIFLSIGYSSCHWCTVMEGEAFSDAAIAEYMNAHFLPIKVDREERPDLDSIYMQALQMMTGEGGWPLNVFLTPQDQVPFFGGTYFPVEPRYGRPGFLQVLQALRQYYDTDKGDLQSRTDTILTHLRQATILPTGQALNAELLQKGLSYSAGVLSSGGQGPSFPMIPYAEATLHGVRFELDGRYDPIKAVVQRGMDLALGGIYDHVAGGFHRYTVDSSWTVPHFEKMLYDNGQIVEYLACLWGLGVEEPTFARAIAGTVQWLKREMTAPQGFFYAAQDADSFLTPDAIEPEEGAFYVWRYSDLQSWLTDGELQELAAQFTITPQGNFEGQNVLQRLHAGALSESLEATLAKLFQIRYGDVPAQVATFPSARNNQAAKSHPWPGRIPSVTDTKMIVAWNSLMISGLAKAYAIFQEPEYLQLAIAATQFILQHQWVEGRFHRLNYDGQPAVLAQSEDYALFIKALLDLHQAAIATESTRPTASFWLNYAVTVQAEFDQWLWSEELGGYFNTASDASETLLVRERSYVDNATPSANGVAIANLIRLALLTENLAHLDQAEQALQAFANIMQETPQACPSLFSALDWFQHHTLVRTQPELLATLSTQYLPTAVVNVASELPSGAIGLVCQGLSCQEPARDLEQLLAQLGQSQVRG